LGLVARFGLSLNICEDLLYVMPREIQSESEIRVGDFYEDCAYHPRLCTVVSPAGDEDGLQGISLVNGAVGWCSARHCGVRLLTVEEAIQWKLHGPSDRQLESERRWW
jgi:hypothetical protein